MSRSCFDYDPGRADYERDSRKHDPRPGEPDYVAPEPFEDDLPPAEYTPHRLAPKVTPALRVAIEVKGCKNIEKAAELIEAYAADMVSRERLERVAAGSGR